MTVIATETILTDQQQAAIDMAVDAIKNKTPLFKIGGYAGTGKTTVAKHIAVELENGLFCAFTGKAAYRLREKGLDGTTTIHRTIYDYVPEIEKFELKHEVGGDYFLIDEGSMISRELWNDLTSFNKPMLLLGDPGQLEPIGGDPELMHKADIVLSQIHRQAEGCGIIQFATDIRLGQFTDGVYPDVEIFHNAKPKVCDLEWADIVLCGFNRTRTICNDYVRNLRGHKGVLCPGEKVIVLRNNMRYGVFNGQILTVNEIVKINDLAVTAKCQTDDDIAITLPFINCFGKKAPNFYGNELVLADYGYCITTHKSQGSEWDKVVVIDEQSPKLWDARRWRYTAITRAAKELRYYFKG